MRSSEQGDERRPRGKQEWYSDKIFYSLVNDNEDKVVIANNKHKGIIIKKTNNEESQIV